MMASVFVFSMFAGTVYFHHRLCLYSFDWMQMRKKCSHMDKNMRLIRMPTANFGYTTNNTLTGNSLMSLVDAMIVIGHHQHVYASVTSHVILLKGRRSRTA
jgi:hypothetical protein